MIEYGVFLYDLNNKPEDYTHFFVDWGDTIYEGLEDALYIRWELKPKDIHWNRKFKAKGSAMFTYHGLEDFVVRYAWDGSGMIYVNQVSPAYGA